MDSLVVDELHFEVRRSPRRHTVQITVDRGGELVLSAPEACPVKKMEGFVREKRFWIYTKLAEKEVLLRDGPRKEYVSGESFPYLGRSYRLLLVQHQDVPVKLDRSRFSMRRDTAATGRAAMIQWYAEHALAWLPQRVARLASRLGVKPATVAVKDLGYRWGSCGKGGTLNFHWRTILLPPRIVEYVIAHELAHLHEPHHTPEFWRRVERAMSDFAARKQWLAENAREAMGV
jgi:predicted metal-dependent hydrolase